MKTTKSSQFATLALLTLLLFPSLVFGQEERPADRGSIELGVRHVWGDVYGRPDLPFQPSFETSKFNEYRDLRTGFFVRRFTLTLDDILGSKNYLSAQSRSAIYRDQSYLVTFGQYGRYKIQFRYDEIPHIYTNTSRTLYTETAPGVFTITPAVRSTLQATSGTNIPATALAQVSSMTFITPAIRRKGATGLVSYDITSDWNIFGLFWRENQVGTRPIGLLLNSSPSASATAGYGAEVPEPIDYFNNLVRVGTEYGRNDWGFQLAYVGSFLQNNIGELVFDNPFRTTDCLAPDPACTNPPPPGPPAPETPGPARGRMDLYPSNSAHYVNFAGAIDVGKHVRAMASITPGWLRQNDPFVPYTSNLLRLAQTGPLPAASLNGDKQTLAMNYTLVATPLKNVQLQAGYRHYDYNNNTPVHGFTGVQGDFGAPATTPFQNQPFGFNKKTIEVTGNWFFAKKSSVKVGYEGEWFDRAHRDVEHSLEHSIIAAVDVSPMKDLFFRVSYRHQNREPEHYEDEFSDGIECEAGALAAARAAFIFPDIHPCARRFDEAARIRDRADALVQYSPFDKLSLSAFAGTIQDDLNRPGDTNSPSPLNFLTGSAATTGPYYLYGLLKDLSYNYGFDATYAFSSAVSVFAEYSHEKYHKRMTSRYRAPAQGATGSANGCGANSAGLPDRGACDSANNDWEST
ncbi:MAG TPA: MtrB/PioB family outer membrane beta-barrel protein, partial [Terriglobales bacterium]|nr:MtrB/PioB family outer membrane beta-barrel protein [Terriglobales bacterium]